MAARRRDLWPWLLAAALLVLGALGALEGVTASAAPPVGEAAVAVASPPREASPEPATGLEGALAGQVFDAGTHAPLAGVTVQAGALGVRTDAEGRFELPRTVTSFLVKAPGYARQTVVVGVSPLSVALVPEVIKAAYLSYTGVRDPKVREKVLALVERTELNGVVIDVKADAGWIPYRTSVPLAVEVGASREPVMDDFDALMQRLGEQRVYRIARIVAFKDNIIARRRPDLAVTDRRTGRAWVDGDGLRWLDPFNEEVWDYVIAVAREAADKGFDEIQFDYVRFAADGSSGAARFSKPSNAKARVAAITGFLERARRELAPTGVFLAADVFGYTAFNQNDTGIGQRIEDMAPHVDYLCPMAYPSGYHVGIPGTPNAMEHPYEIVAETVKHTRARTRGLPLRVRPWLQDFRDYAFDRRMFRAKEIRAQARGADDADGSGWMLWNPRNVYTASALAPAEAGTGDKGLSAAPASK